MAKSKSPARGAAARPARVDANVIGSTGLKQFGGVVVEEFLKELSGARGMRTYREMGDNDEICGAILFTFSMLARQAEWTVQAADDSSAAEEGKVFLEEVLGDMSRPFSAVINDVCSKFRYGYAPLEIVYKRRVGPYEPKGDTRSKYTDGKIGVRDIALRAQPTISHWEFDREDGSILGLHQQPYERPMVFIPIEKLLLFRTTEEANNPEGKSILRTAYRAWYFKKRIEEFEAVGVERDLAGLPVGKMPAMYMDPSASPEEKAVYQAWTRMVQQIKRDQREGIVIPSDTDQHGKPLFDLVLLSTGGSRTFDTTKIVDRKNRGIATSVLADFIFLGQQSVGSFALSSDKTALFATALGGFMKADADVFNRHFIPRLWRYNGMDPATQPSMVPQDLEVPNLPELAAYISALVGAGMPLFPDRELENHLRKTGGLTPAPEDGEAQPKLPDLPKPGASDRAEEDEE